MQAVALAAISQGEVCVRVLPWLLLLSLSASGWAAEISGHIELSAEGKPLRAEEAQDAIVYFRPKVPMQAVPATPMQQMSTVRKQFTPRVMATTVGSEVRFPNQDPILHNAFSTSKDNAFDVGLYGQGDGQAVTFSKVGYVRVYCNVHHSMIGHILVLDTPYFVHPDSSGNFRLANLPAGEGDLVVWHDRATPWHTVVNAGAENKPFAVPLELSQRRIAPHMNKFGKPYGRSSDGGY
jgi:plastocyanin